MKNLPSGETQLTQKLVQQVLYFEFLRVIPTILILFVLSQTIFVVIVVGVGVVIIGNTIALLDLNCSYMKLFSIGNLNTAVISHFYVAFSGLIRNSPKPYRECDRSDYQ